MSRRVMETLRALVGERNVEVYSVDEAFLDVNKIDEKYLAERSSRRIFQSRLSPEDANFTTSSLILKLRLSTAFIKNRLFFSEGGANKLLCIEMSGTKPLNITPAFLYSRPRL